MSTLPLIPVLITLAALALWSRAHRNDEFAKFTARQRAPAPHFCEGLFWDLDQVEIMLSLQAGKLEFNRLPPCLQGIPLPDRFIETGRNQHQQIIWTLRSVADNQHRQRDRRNAKARAAQEYPVP